MHQVLQFKNMKRLCRSLALAAVAILLITVSVLASYYVYFTVTESNGTDYTELAMNYTFDIEDLVDGGYINATGLDTRVTDSGYTVLPHMLAEDKVMWVSDLAGNTSTQFIFFMGQEAMESFPTITGHGGYVTVPDNANLEPGDIYAFGVVGYVDTSGGNNKTIIRKDGAVTLDASVAGNITFNVIGSNSLTAANVTAGYMTIMIYCDGYELWMDIDDVEQDVAEACSILDTSSNWFLFENDVMPYVSYYGEWVAT